MAAPKIFLFSALFVVLLGGKAMPQTAELLPEVDVYYQVQPDLRVWVQAKETREGGDPVQAEIGPSLDFYLKPWVKLKGAVAFALDESKARPLVFSIGYRYLPSPDQASKSRLEPVATLNFPLKGRFLLSDRNRLDLDWQNSEFSWRYRNRLSLERAIHVHGYHPAPYVSAEFFYESKYEKWSDTAIYAGCLFPIGKRVEFSPYYEHQNVTSDSPNRQLNQLGLMLNLFF